MIVALAPHEMRMALNVAVERRLASMGRLHHAYGYEPETPFDDEVHAAGAEIACARCLDRYYDGSFNTFKRGDIGEKVQVRHTKHRDGCLIIRPGDADDETFFLVRGALPVYEVVGSITGSEAKTYDIYWKSPNDRPGAWFIPALVLTPVETNGRAA